MIVVYLKSLPCICGQYTEKMSLVF